MDETLVGMTRTNFWRGAMKMRCVWLNWTRKSVVIPRIRAPG